MQTTIWRQFKFEHPDDWEMLQFTRNFESGRCVFASRYQVRFELDWREVDGIPDFERMIQDYQSLLEEEGFDHLRTVRRGQWHGVNGERNGRVTTRFGAYFEEGGVMVEVVLLWPKERDVRLEQRLLSSFSYQPEVDDMVRWRAFGMDLKVCAGHDLWKVSAEPASVEMKFTTQKGYREIRFARRGMLDYWLDRSLDQWLYKQLPKGFDVTERKRHIRGDHEIYSLEGVRRLPTAKDIFRGKRLIKASAWICPRDKRLYSSLLVSTDRFIREESLISLRCCERLEVSP